MSASAPASSPLPFGPQTAALRQALVRLAALGAQDRARIVAAYRDAERASAWAAAETRLAEAITRSGRADAQQALAGPFLQLMRRRAAAPHDDAADLADADLDEVAEPALAALLALLAADLLPPADVQLLTAPLRTAVALDDLPPR